MTACKQTASTGIDVTMDEADSNSAAKRDGADERKPWTKCRKGKKAKGKLAVKSDGAEKPKTHDLSDVTCGLALMNIKVDDVFVLRTYQNHFWMKYSKHICDRPSVDADKAPYVAKARVNKISLAQVAEFKNKISLAHVAEFKKILMLAEAMTKKKVNLKL